ncbi:MAG: hypothetical protein WC554_18340, partial [Clostridia bacterium]
FGKTKFIGINSYGITTAIEITNLSFLNAINSSININERTSLIINFGYNRIMSKRFSNIAGSFAFSCFGGDIFSEHTYNPNIQSSKGVMNYMTDKKPSEYSYYDIIEKRFNKSVPQLEWYGLDLTKKSMEKVSVAEGLSGYKVIKCISHFYQQRDLNFINELIISKNNIFEDMKNYVGWGIFLNSLVLPLSSNQKNLSEF